MRARPDEDDVEFVAELGESSVLGDEAPADPGGLGAGGDQRLFECFVVEIAALLVSVASVDERCGAEGPDHVRLADVEGPGVRLRVERDGFEVVVGLAIQLAHCVNEPHRRLTAIDDGDLSEVSLHRLVTSSTPSQIEPGRADRH